MKNLAHLVICFLLLFGGTIDGQNDYYLTAIDKRFTANNNIDYAGIEVEVTLEWEVTYSLDNDKKSSVPTILDNNTSLYNNIQTIPAFDIKHARLSKKSELKPQPIHASQIQLPRSVSLLPKQVIQPMMINKRPKSFGALYAF